MMVGRSFPASHDSISRNHMPNNPGEPPRLYDGLVGAANRKCMVRAIAAIKGLWPCQLLHGNPYLSLPLDHGRPRGFWPGQIHLFPRILGSGHIIQTRLSFQSVGLLAHKWTRVAGISRFSPHDLRRTLGDGAEGVEKSLFVHFTTVRSRAKKRASKEQAPSSLHQPDDQAHLGRPVAA
jgi:hypothetical protein